MSAVHVELLRAARAMIEGEDVEYICVAIEHCVSWQWDKAGDDADRIHQLDMAWHDISCKIVKGLGRYDTLHTWLIDQYFHAKPYSLSKRRDICLLARLAWIDKMIEEYSDDTPRT
jgi:hypothetical protein